MASNGTATDCGKGNSMAQVVITCGNKTKRTLEVADGTSLQDVMLAQNPETKNWPTPTVCVFRGQPILRRDWPTTILEGDAVATFAELPMGGGGGGGGSNTLQVVLMVVVIIVATIASYGTATAPSVAAALGSAGAAQIAGAMVGAAIMMAGSMLLGAIFATPVPSMPSGQVGAASAEASSPTYNINATGNAARLYQPIPEGFGRMRITPDKIANPWAQYIKNEYYLYQVFGRGRGSYEVESMAFGDVVFWRNGHFIESAYTPLQTDQEIKTPMNILLPYGVGGQPGAMCAPQVAVPADTSTAVLHVRIGFPDGIGYTEYHGEEQVWHPPLNQDDYGYWETIPAYSVPYPETRRYRAEYQQIDASGNPVGDWVLVGEGQYSAATTAALSAVLSCTLPKFERVRVRAQNTSTSADTQRVLLQETVIYACAVEVQFFEAGQPVTLFPDNVEPTDGVASQELLAPNASGDWIGAFPTNAPGTKTSKIQVDLILPRGLGRYNDQGGLNAISASVEFVYRDIDDLGNPTSAWKTLFTNTFSDATLTAIRKTFDIDVPSGRYEARGRRTTNSTASDGRTMDVIQWESMKAFLPGALSYNQSGVAIKIKASNALSQNSANKFTLIQTRKLPTYDTTTGTWSVAQPTRSFAAGLSAVLKADHGGQRKDRNIDLQMLWGVIHPVLTQRGWNFDCWIDGAYDVWQLVQELCQPYLVLPRISGSVVSFAFDRPNRSPSHEFTPYNIVRGTFQPTWGTYSDSSPDDVQVAYLDADAGFASRDVRASLPESEGKKPAQKSYLGVVNRNHAYQIGMAYAARNRFRRLSWEFETEGMGRILNLGEVVTLNHPRLRDTAFGQVQGWSAESLTILSQNDIKVQDTTTDLYLSLSRPNGKPWGPVKLRGVSKNAFTLDAEDFALLITQGFESPFDWLTGGSDRLATVWTLQTSREYKRRVIITSAIPTSLYRYKITVINDDPRVDDHIAELAPAWQFRTGTGTITALTAPESVRGYIGGTALLPTITVSWLPVVGADSYLVSFSTDGIDWAAGISVTANVYTGSIPVGPVYVRVSALRDGEQSAWTLWHGDTTVTVPPAPVPVLTSPYSAALLSLSWAAVQGDPSYVVKIYPAGSSTPVRQAPLAQTSYQYTALLGIDDGGPWRQLRADVIAVNTAGESAVGSITASDLPPTVISYSGSVTSNSATLTAAASSQKATGFVLVRGASADFVVPSILESRVVASLPYTWTGLSPNTTYYFRVAAKDAFFDVSGDLESLTYTDVIVITTSGGA